MYLKFYSRSKFGKPLSNFYNLNVVIDNILYITGEHAFHGQKYKQIAQNINDIKRKNELLNYSLIFEGKDTKLKKSNDAKKAGGRKGLELNNQEREIWNKLSENIQYKISMYKYENYDIIKDILKEYKDYYLLHQENRANNKSIWGGRIKDDKLIGKNKLGKIWMKIQKLIE
jgi:predicted NAD-dependent protein-ADP-ribosyltransferase YbiA (DUF1768 family)